MCRVQGSGCRDSGEQPRLQTGRKPSRGNRILKGLIPYLPEYPGNHDRITRPCVHRRRHFSLSHHPPPLSLPNFNTYPINSTTYPPPSATYPLSSHTTEAGPTQIAHLVADRDLTAPGLTPATSNLSTTCSTPTRPRPRLTGAASLLTIQSPELTQPGPTLSQHVPILYRTRFSSCLALFTAPDFELHCPLPTPSVPSVITFQLDVARRRLTASCDPLTLEGPELMTAARALMRSSIEIQENVNEFHVR